MKWKTFCNFHSGNYKAALDQYQKENLTSKNAIDSNTLAINGAICMFFLGKTFYHFSEEFSL